MVATIAKPTYFRRCGCCCFTFIVAPIAVAMLMEVLFGVWFMNQHQGLLPPLPYISTMPTTQSIDGTPYTHIGRYEILERLPHDTNAFTQGLVMIADTTSSLDDVDSETSSQEVHQYLYEGTGMYGASQLRRLDIHTGNLLAHYPLEKSYFGEGIAHYRDKSDRLHIIQLTWKRQRAFEYIFNTSTKGNDFANTKSPDHLFADRVTSWRYETTTNEGWGITYSPKEHILFVSDGSEYIHIWNAETKKEISKFAVKYIHHGNDKMDETTKITMLNELEYDPVTNTILANVWRESIIIRINPQTGFVTNMYDLKNLLPRRDRTWHTDVLNGIALTYDLTIPSQPVDPEKNSDIWVTGKYWPCMFRIRLIDGSCTWTEVDDGDAKKSSSNY